MHFAALSVMGYEGTWFGSDENNLDPFHMLDPLKSRRQEWAKEQKTEQFMLIRQGYVFLYNL